MAVWNLSCSLVAVLVALAHVFSEIRVPYLTEDIGYKHTKANLVEVLQTIHRQRHVENLLIYRTKQNSAASCPFVDLMKSFNQPVIILDNESTFSFKTVFSSEVIILFCEYHPSDRALLERSKILQELLNSRYIVYLEHGSEINAEVKVESCCKDYFTLEIYNVLVILSDFGTAITYYSCHKYSTNGRLYQVKSIIESVTLYENQFLNMYGDIITTFTDQVQPRTILLYDSDGNLHLEGYVGKLLTTFAAKLNATLAYKYHIQPGVKISEEDMLHILRNGSLDIVSMLAANQAMQNFNDITYPYEYVNYCYMIPLPNAIPKNKIFTSIIKVHVLLAIFVIFVTFAALLTFSLKGSLKEMNFVNVFLNDKSMRGLLGQPFTMIAEPSFNTQFLCFLLCYTSLLINTMYQAYLQASFTSPPTEPMVRSYEDIAVAGLKIFMWSGELQFFNTSKEHERDPHFFDKYEHIIEATQNYTEFILNRASLNTKYVYPVTNTRWRIFIEQQKLFGRPLFYYSSDICFFDFAIHGIAVREGLPYRDLFEDHILRIHESGIFGFWFLSNIYDMEETNLTNLKALRSTQRYGGPIEFMDFYWIWWLYLLNVTFCVLGFVWEIGTWRVKFRARACV